MLTIRGYSSALNNLVKQHKNIAKADENAKKYHISAWLFAFREFPFKTQTEVFCSMYDVQSTKRFRSLRFKTQTDLLGICLGSQKSKVFLGQKSQLGFQKSTCGLPRWMF